MYRDEEYGRGRRDDFDRGWDRSERFGRDPEGYRAERGYGRDRDYWYGERGGWDRDFGRRGFGGRDDERERGDWRERDWGRGYGGPQWGNEAYYTGERGGWGPRFEGRGYGGRSGGEGYGGREWDRWEPGDRDRWSRWDLGDRERGWDRWDLSDRDRGYGWGRRDERERWGGPEGYGARGGYGYGWGRRFGGTDYGREHEREGRGFFERIKDRLTGKGPKGYQRADDRIREDVCDRLNEHPWADSSDVEVRVQSGEVTLIGTVPERAHKRVIEDIAEEVRGVKDVHNQIRVKREEVFGRENGQRERTTTQTSANVRA